MNPLQNILKNDSALNNELAQILDSGFNIPIAKKFGISQNVIKKAMVGANAEFPLAEAMIMLHLRPALLIKNNKIEPPDSSELRNRLLPYFPKLESLLPSIGRIDFKKMGKPYGGTGWMVTEDILVTNRHVAQLFAERKGKSLVFRKNAIGETIEAFIDYKEEYAGPNISPMQNEIAIEKILYISEDKKNIPDIAFVQLKKNDFLPPPIPISTSKLFSKQNVSVIGYPAYDPNGIISVSAASNVFRGIYEVKRCSPGEVTEYDNSSWYFFHDCTTLGGNSGSCVIDNESGVAVGLHFMGEVSKQNYAVKGTEIIKHLKKIRPQITVSNQNFAKIEEISDDATLLESVPESYIDRKGYDESFLGTKYKISFPTVTKNKNQVLKFSIDEKITTELKYTHFSVVMNEKRRMCIFSACNIDGQTSIKGVKRTQWKKDSRIPDEMQIIDECYGKPPKFSRGHMTRKEDPIWGSLETARQGCADTFHVTNVTPQMQPFNAPVWLELENYALENARQDEMRITVITGPIFTKTDPEKYGIQIPLSFFKIIAFIHDETKKLTATGYTISQEEYLSHEEFVYGALKTYQVSIKSIENRTGLKFANLTSVDPIRGEESIVTALSSLSDIKFS